MRYKIKHVKQDSMGKGIIHSAFYYIVKPDNTRFKVKLHTLEEALEICNTLNDLLEKEEEEM